MISHVRCQTLLTAQSNFKGVFHNCSHLAFLVRSCCAHVFNVTPPSPWLKLCSFVNTFYSRRYYCWRWSKDDLQYIFPLLDRKRDRDHLLKHFQKPNIGISRQIISIKSFVRCCPRIFPFRTWLCGFLVTSVYHLYWSSGTPGSHSIAGNAKIG